MSESGTLGTREDSSHFSFWYPRDSILQNDSDSGVNDLSPKDWDSDSDDLSGDFPFIFVLLKTLLFPSFRSLWAFFFIRATNIRARCRQASSDIYYRNASTAQHSTAQSTRTTSSKSNYSPISARQRKQADKTWLEPAVSSSIYTVYGSLCSQNEPRNRNLPGA